MNGLIDDLKLHRFVKVCGVFICPETLLSYENVGAINDRPYGIFYDTLKFHRFVKVCGVFICPETLLSFGNVGAIIDRPPKNAVFRIFRRKISLFSPFGEGFCLGKIHGRSMIAPTGFSMTR